MENTAGAGHLVLFFAVRCRVRHTIAVTRDDSTHPPPNSRMTPPTATLVTSYQCCCRGCSAVSVDTRPVVFSATAVRG